MKTINITFTVTDAEQELLRLGKCDKPHPQRIKMQLLVEAARNLRNMSETVVRAARGRPQTNTVTENGVRRRKGQPLQGAALGHIEGFARPKPKRSPRIPLDPVKPGDKIN